MAEGVRTGKCGKRIGMGKWKERICKKYVLRAAAVFCAAVVLGMSGCHVNAGKGDLSAGTKQSLFQKPEDRFYPSQEEALRFVDTLPLLCTPVEETYQKNEDGPGFPEEMLADLQEYVRRGEAEEAIDAYRDETLLVDREEMRELCPEYENLLAEWMGEHLDITVKPEDVSDNIVQIYQLKQEGEKELLLLEYSGLEIPWYYIAKEGEAYQIGTAWLERYGDLRGQPGERVVFADEDGYCLLLCGTVRRTYTEEEELLRLRRFTLREEEGESLFIVEETRYIRARTTRVAPDFFYLNGGAALTPAVQEYVEENAAVFADRLLGDEVIWGDEEYAKVPEKGTEILWTESDKQDTIEDWQWMDHVCQADYDNDGREELFWRGFLWGRRENALLEEENDGYRTAYVRLFDKEVIAEQMWFVEFEGKIITFEISEPYGADCPLLSAYLIEENKKTPILTCQLVYGQTVEIDKDFYVGYGYDTDCFRIKPVVPLIAGLEESEEQAAFREKLTAWIRGVGEEVTIMPVNTLATDTLSEEGEVPLPEDFLAFLREGAAWSMSGRYFSVYASPYEVDTEGDFAEFEEKYKEQLSHSDAWYDMVYRWEAEDGTDNYLVSEAVDFWEEVNTLYWYRDDGEGVYQKEAITDLSTGYGSYCGILSYGGRRYCVIVGRDTWISPLRMDLITLGDAGEWEHYCISLTYESEQYDAYALYDADMPAALPDYVSEEFEEILMCMHWEVYEGRGAYDELPNAVWRNIKNRDLSYAVQYAAYTSWSTPGHNRYREVDVDNDGEPEYTASYQVWAPRGDRFLFHTIYGWRDGAFVELSLGEGILDSYQDMDDAYGVLGGLEQLWFEELDGVTYLFTVEELSLFDSYLLRVRLIKDGEVQDVGAWLFRHNGAILEDIRKMEEYESWMAA